MKTIRCPECNLVNWTTAVDCKRCRFVFQTEGAVTVETASVGGFQPAQNQFATRTFADLNGAQDFAPQTNFQPRQTQSNYQQPSNNYAPHNYYPQNYQPLNLKSGLAIASMVFGILAIVTAIFLIGILFAPIGAILAIIALVKASKKPNEYGGKGFAVAGLVTSGMVLFIIPVIAAIAIPNLMAARRSANEGSSISTIRTIAKAQGNSTFNGKMLKCSSLADLAKNKIVNENLADGENNGYRFAINDFPFGGCEITATPISPSHGTRSFYYSTEDGKIRGATKSGAIASKYDPTID